jgi:leukotriene-A4 hydrolase
MATNVDPIPRALATSHYHRSLTGLVLALLTSTSSAAIGSSLDPSSYSNVEEFRPDHLSFNMFVNFADSSVDGIVTHTMEVLNSESTMVYMDVWGGLTVKTAEFMAMNATDCPSNFTELPFEITEPNPNIGSALSLELPCTMPIGTEFFLKFSYITDADNYAMSWMTPEQTGGKVLPFMYSLCQMNYCRSFAPMMDTPSMKITYDATVVVAKEFVAKMSANTTSMEAYNETHNIYAFDATIKIPSYLIAIVVGDLVEVQLDERVSVVSEPVYIDRAVEEFEELPQFLNVAEDYLIPYAWGTYSIVIMPPSFPWGGMEHPLITFASPTLVVGDKSRVSVAIHEITHSWFGNDVGCQNWDNLWINEGLNTWMEQKTLELVRGPDFTTINYHNSNITMFLDIEDYGVTDSYTARTYHIVRVSLSSFSAYIVLYHFGCIVCVCVIF